MPARLPPLHDLVDFEAAARLSSFLKAAEELHVTQSAVSHRIKALEEFLGVPLFIRVHRNIALTSFGEHYLADVRGALAQLGAATANLIGSPGSRRRDSTGTSRRPVGQTLRDRNPLPRLHDCVVSGGGPQACGDIVYRVAAVAGGRPSVKRKIAPAPGAPSARMRPPWRSTIRWVKASPMPAPLNSASLCRRSNGRNSLST